MNELLPSRQPPTENGVDPTPRPGGHRQRPEVTVTPPADPPVLNPHTARALLKILLAAATPADHPPGEMNDIDHQSEGYPTTNHSSTPGAIMNFAFYRLATATSRRAARPAHAHQLTAATTRVQRHGGAIVADYFDVYPDRYRAVRHCRHGRRLLQAIEGPQRDFDAVVIGDTRSALSPYRYDELLWHCDNHDVQLWIPEIDGPVDPNSDHHQKIVNVLFWGPLATAL